MIIDEKKIHHKGIYEIETVMVVDTLNNSSLNKLYIFVN